MTVDWVSVQERGWNLREDKSLRILSIDGGGIRGIFSATYLSLLEDHLQVRTCDFFDMIVGTSTGSIIALALSIGIPATEIANLYLQHASRIFSKRRFSVGGLARSKYTNVALKRLLQDTLGNHVMNQALTMLAIPSVEHTKAQPKVFKTPHREQYFQDAEIPMWKVALASSAAPIYFPATETVHNDCKIDGGLWANNPVMVGVTEAQIMGFGPDAIKVLSVGTGKHIYSVDNRVAKRSSLVRYRGKIVDLIMQVQTASADYMAKHIVGTNLVRVDSVMGRKIEMDSTNSGDLKHLQHEAYTVSGNSMVQVKNLFGI